jgi:hypothetical protein
MQNADQAGRPGFKNKKKQAVGLALNMTVSTQALWTAFIINAMTAITSKT